MSVAARSTLEDFSCHHPYVSWPTRIASGIRGLSVLLVKECPLLWSRMLQGSRNPRADMEGKRHDIPAYVNKRYSP